MRIPWHRITVAPIATPPIFSTSLDGVLGVDVLSAFDVDLDLPHHQLMLYERGHCKDPNWSGRYVKLETGHSRSDHLFFSVLLDNHRVTATIDTGSQNTVLSTGAAHRFGLAESSLAHDRPVKTKGAAGEVLNSHVHKFTQLKIGSITIPGPEIVVADLRLPDIDIVLGMDLFRTRRLWLSYAASSIFVAER